MFHANKYSGTNENNLLIFFYLDRWGFDSTSWTRLGIWATTGASTEGNVDALVSDCWVTSVCFFPVLRLGTNSSSLSSSEELGSIIFHLHTRKTTFLNMFRGGPKTFRWNDFINLIENCVKIFIKMYYRVTLPTHDKAIQNYRH